MSRDVYVLGGAQTDFARNLTREGKDLAALVREPVEGALADSRVSAGEIQVVHVGNFAAELYSGQGHLGGLLVEADPAFAGLPASRHEAACASGSMAVLAAMADLEAGRYDVALVVGVELMRARPGVEAQRQLAAAAWVPRETEGVEYPWPTLFSALVEAYDERYGLAVEHLHAIGRTNFENARRNPNALARSWTFPGSAFTADDVANPVVSGRIRRNDCSQISDGAAAVVLAAGPFAAERASRTGRSLADLALIRGWGHHTGRMTFRDTLAERGEYVLPQVRRSIVDACRRAGIASVAQLDVIECHDCFTISEYMAIDHFGLTPPGQSWRAIEEDVIGPGGSLPLNPSGGLIGAGHPVGATGVRLLLDACKQVTGSAGDYQVPGARTAATLNLGGSATTSACFVVGRGPA